MPVIDEMLVCKVAQYSYLFAVAVHKKYSLVCRCVAKLFIVQNVYCLQYEHPYPATQVTMVAIVV